MYVWYEYRYMQALQYCWVLVLVLLISKRHPDTHIHKSFAFKPWAVNPGGVNGDIPPKVLGAGCRDGNAEVLSPCRWWGEGLHGNIPPDSYASKYCLVWCWILYVKSRIVTRGIDESKGIFTPWLVLLTFTDNVFPHCFPPSGEIHQLRNIKIWESLSADIFKVHLLPICYGNFLKVKHFVVVNLHWNFMKDLVNFGNFTHLCAFQKVVAISAVNLPLHFVKNDSTEKFAVHCMASWDW